MKSNFLHVTISSGDKSILLIICIDAPESTINSLSSGLTVVVDATHQSNFGLLNVASFSKYFPRILYNCLVHCQVIFLASSSTQRVLFGSLFSNVGAFELRRCLCPPWMTPRDGPICSRMLMNLTAVSENFSSTCAFGDLSFIRHSRTDANYRMTAPCICFFRLLKHIFTVLALRSLFWKRELGRSRWPLPLPCFVMSCLKLHDSPPKPFPFANHSLQSPSFPSSLFATVRSFTSWELHSLSCRFGHRNVDPSSPDPKTF